MVNLDISTFGPDAVLAHVASSRDVRVLDAALSAAAAPGVTDIVPAAQSVLVVFDPQATSHTRIAEWMRDRAASAADAPADDAPVVELRVRYDGADLPAVAEFAGLTVADLADRHGAAELTVAFCGFAPGFAYLEGFDLGVDIPRRATPRERVPAGAVAVAARYTAVYPTALPGGWQLIGTCLDRVFDLDRAEPALLLPGRRVRWIPVP